MAKKSGKNADKQSDAIKSEPEKQAGMDKKIYIAIIVLALAGIGGMILFGSNLMTPSQAPKVPGVINTTPAATPNLPAATVTIATPIPKQTTSAVTIQKTTTKSPAVTDSSLSAIFFYGYGCSACEKVQPVIADIQAKYPELHIEMLEVNNNRTNMDSFIQMRQQYGVENSWFAIPSVFIGKKVLIGEPEIKDHFEEYVLAEKKRVAA